MVGKTMLMIALTICFAATASALAVNNSMFSLRAGFGSVPMAGNTSHVVADVGAFKQPVGNVSGSTTGVCQGLWCNGDNLVVPAPPPPVQYGNYTMFRSGRGSVPGSFNTGSYRVDAGSFKQPLGSANSSLVTLCQGLWCRNVTVAQALAIAESPAGNYTIWRSGRGSLPLSALSESYRLDAGSFKSTLRSEVSGNFTICRGVWCTSVQSLTIPTTDSCTPPTSSDWTVSCEDLCLNQIEQDVGTLNILITGIGNFTTTQNIHYAGSLDMNISQGCTVTCTGGCFQRS